LSQYIPGVQGVSVELPFGQKFPTVHCPPCAVRVGRATVAPVLQYHPPSQSPVGCERPTVSQYFLSKQYHIKQMTKKTALSSRKIKVMKSLVRKKNKKSHKMEIMIKHLKLSNQKTEAIML
jgi:hypothetical protein